MKVSIAQNVLAKTVDFVPAGTIFTCKFIDNTFGPYLKPEEHHYDFKEHIHCYNLITNRMEAVNRSCLVKDILGTIVVSE